MRQRGTDKERQYKAHRDRKSLVSHLSMIARNLKRLFLFCSQISWELEQCLSLSVSSVKKEVTTMVDVCKYMNTLMYLWC